MFSVKVYRKPHVSGERLPESDTFLVKVYTGKHTFPLNGYRKALRFRGALTGNDTFPLNAYRKAHVSGERLPETHVSGERLPESISFPVNVYQKAFRFR